MTRPQSRWVRWPGAVKKPTPRIAYGADYNPEQWSEDVWDEDVDIRSNALDVHMSRLRNHLAGSQLVMIRTLRGVGYRLEKAKR